MRAVTIHLSPDQQDQILCLVAMVLAMMIAGVVVIVDFAVKISGLRRANDDLRHRLLTAQSVGQTQAVALRTVDALARASQWSRS